MNTRSIALLAAPLILASAASAQLDTWNDTDTKAAIIDFVESVTTEGSPSYIEPAERIATFDNDGCLWAEQPLYFQVIFAMDRVRELASEHPEWENTEPFKSVIAGDMKGVMASGKEGLAKILAASHTGMTADEFADSVRRWLDSATHPTTGKHYDEMVYQPMLELLDYLRDNGFKTFIVSGGGIDFMRVFAEDTYGIPPEQVVGSTIDAEFEMRDGVPTIVKTAKLILNDDKTGKPIGIYRHIGRRPIFAAGNSDGDLQMIQYTTAGDGARFGLIVHHTDADREWAYDRDSHIGKLDQALDEAQTHGWTVVDMSQDWRTVFADD